MPFFLLFFFPLTARFFLLWSANKKTALHNLSIVVVLQCNKFELQCDYGDTKFFILAEMPVPGDYRRRRKRGLIEFLGKGVFARLATSNLFAREIEPYLEGLSNAPHG